MATRLTDYEQEALRLLTENNAMLKQNIQILLQIEDHLRKIKYNTNG